MERFYIFKDGTMQGSTATKESAVDFIRQYQKQETYPILRAEFSIIKGEEEFTPLPVPEESTKEKGHNGAIRTYSSTPSISRNCATVMHLGCSIFRLRKSLSPVSMMSMS